MKIRYAFGAIRDLQRLREFLRPKNPLAAKRAAQAILLGVKVLEQQPHIGRPMVDLATEFREWVIPFGNSGYVAMYHFDGESLTILAIRHQKEAGYEAPVS